MLLQNDIDRMIMMARKNGRKDTLLVYQDIKAEFVKFKTKEVPQGEQAPILDEKEELNILNKMIKNRKQSYEIFTASGRTDLADKEAFEIAAIQELLPAAPTEEDYNRVIDEYITTLGDIEFDKSQMGKCIKFVKEKLIGADGKILSQLVQKRFV